MSDAERVSVSLVTAEQAAELVEAICDLYDEVFSVPPYEFPDFESPQQRGTLKAVIANPASAVSAASIGDELVGFCYGAPLNPGGMYWHGFREPVAADVTQEWPGRTFLVIELAVRASRRRRGIGRALLESTLKDRSEERATLSARPTPMEAHAFYRALGWILVGRQDTPGLISSEFDVYVRDLPSVPKR